MALEAELERATVSVEPGRTASCEVRLRNSGGAAEVVQLGLTGEAAAYGWAVPLELTVAPEGEAVAKVCFQLPRASTPAAGPLPFSLTVTGPSGASAGADGALVVEPFVEVTGRLEPAVLEGRQGTLIFRVENRGNARAPVHVEVAGEDGLRVEASPAELVVEPGADARATVAVKGQPAWLRAVERPVSAWAVVGGSRVASGTATVHERPERRLVAIGAALVLLWVAIGLWTATDGGGRRSETADAGIGLERVELLPVGMRVEVFVDESRPTPAQGSEPERPSRQLVTTIYYPSTGPPGAPVLDAPVATDKGPYPLIVFSHGFGLSGRSASILLSKWAGAGYVVAAPDFPLTSSGTAGGPRRGSVDVPNQPGDASFVLSELTRASADPASPLHGLVDPTRVVAAGYSMGGGVTMGMAFNTCCRDDRIKAAVVLAGTQPAYAGQYFAGPPTPVLFVHGDRDQTVPYPRARQLFADAPPPKLLLSVIGGDHGSPYSGDLGAPESALVVAATTAFFDHHLKGSSRALERLNEEVANQPSVATLEGFMGE